MGREQNKTKTFSESPTVTVPVTQDLVISYKRKRSEQQGHRRKKTPRAAGLPVPPNPHPAASSRPGRPRLTLQTGSRHCGARVPAHHLRRKGSGAWSSGCQGGESEMPPCSPALCWVGDRGMDGPQRRPIITSSPRLKPSPSSL